MRLHAGWQRRMPHEGVPHEMEGVPHDKHQSSGAGWATGWGDEIIGFDGASSSMHAMPQGGGPIASRAQVEHAQLGRHAPPPRPSTGHGGHRPRSPTLSPRQRTTPALFVTEQHRPPAFSTRPLQTAAAAQPLAPGAQNATGVWVGASCAGPLSRWGTQHVVAWLCNELGLAEHGSTFRKAQIDGLCLSHLDGPALCELGVPADQQKLLLSATRTLAAATTEPPVSGLSAGARRVRSWGTLEVSSWLNEVVGLPRYCPQWEASAIDGTVLLCLDRVSLEELGVASALHRSLLLAEVERLHRTLAPMESTPAKAAPAAADAAPVEREQEGPPVFEADLPRQITSAQQQRDWERQAWEEARRWEEEQQARQQVELQKQQQMQQQRALELATQERELARQEQAIPEPPAQRLRGPARTQSAGLSLSLASATPPLALSTATSDATAPPIRSWDAADVGGWIARTIRLPQYSNAFVDQEIDGSLLAVLDEDSLR